MIKSRVTCDSIGRHASVSDFCEYRLTLHEIILVTDHFLRKTIFCNDLEAEVFQKPPLAKTSLCHRLTDKQDESRENIVLLSRRIECVGGTMPKCESITLRGAPAKRSIRKRSDAFERFHQERLHKNDNTR